MLRALIRGSLVLLAVFALSEGQARANGCDLSTVTSTCTFGAGVFDAADPHPTGTGFIDSFLRVQQNGNEQGYNTSDRSYSTPGGMQPIIQDKTDPNFTRDLPIANIGKETIGTTQYYAFFLDVNEQATNNGSKNLISLDQLEIFTSSTPVSGKQPFYSNSGNNNASGTLDLAGNPINKIYDMDTAIADNWVNINYNLSSGGSGTGDMVFFLPVSLFGNAKYVYLYSEFGSGLTGDPNSNSKYASGAGFEEWWTMSPTQVTPFNAVPEPSSIALLGIGLIVLGRHYQRRRPGQASKI